VAPAVAPLAPGAYGSKGTMEADGALALGYPTWSGADFDMLFIPGFHYFIMDRLSVGATMRIGFVTGGGGFTVFQFVPGAQYHFNPTASNLIPYLGAGLGFDYWSAGGGSDTAFLLDLEGGVKFNLAPRMFAGAGIDIPIAFHSKTGAYLNVLGRYIYTF
jgi:OprF membrane domain.